MAPPKVTSATDDEFKFLMEIIEAGGPGKWSELATKWGPPYTSGALSMRWQRIKKKYDAMKAADGTATASTAAPTTKTIKATRAIKATTPAPGWKFINGESEEEEGEDEVVKKGKGGKKRKATPGVDEEGIAKGGKKGRKAQKVKEEAVDEDADEQA